MPNILDVCRADLFTKEDDLLQKYPQVIVEKLLRIREMYNWFLSNPSGSDREFVSEICQRHGIHKTTAYKDIAVVKALLPMLGSASRDFHRWRTNEMLINTYKKAEKRGDTKSMERAASQYGRLNRVDVEDEQAMPYDKIVPQPFTATDDPRVLGIEPTPNIKDKILKLIDKYRKESIDIEDVEFEEYDLEFETLFPDKENDSEDGGKENLF